MIAGYLKETLGVKQMVSNGNEGYRAQGIYDPYASTTYPFNVRHALELLPAFMQSPLHPDCIRGILSSAAVRAHCL